jgi:hypothetical protein
MQPAQIAKSIAHAHARGTGPAGVSNRRTPSGVINDKRPSSNLGPNLQGTTKWGNQALPFMRIFFI